MKRNGKLWTAGIIFLIFFGVTLIVKQQRHKISLLRVGFPERWGDLTPALQHTVYADSVIENVFEPLLSFTKLGSPAPGAAITWSVSEDSRVFRFQVDTNRRFSDGTHLRAQDFKDSWERGLALVPKSANSSLADVMYKVEGAEEFPQTHTLKGIVVLNESELEVRFSTPFRMALEHLAGKRFAAVRWLGDKQIGTGPYVFDSISDDKVLLSKNPYFSGDVPFPNVEILVQPREHAVDAIKRGELHAFYSFAKGIASACDNASEEVGCISGQENAHHVLTVNGLPGRVLNDPNLRLGLQSLVWESLMDGQKLRKAYESPIFRIDPQIFMSFQSGRLDDDEVSKFLASGKQFINKLIDETKVRPLYFISARDDLEILNYLRNAGISFTKESGRVSFSDLAKMYYKSTEPDLIFNAVSVSNVDPDGIYHALGRSGAISSPMLKRERVCDLLEEGRKVFNPSKLHSYYSEVSRAVLTEVPFVHIGFSRQQVIFASKLIQASAAFQNRDHTGVIGFEQK